MVLRAACFIGLVAVTACGGSMDRDSDGTAGGAGGGGSANQGGDPGDGGAGGVGGAGGNTQCGPVACAPVSCTEGRVVTPPGQCCPICSCEGLDCAFPQCTSGATPIVGPGRCCPTCPPDDSSCKGVACQADSTCGTGYSYQRPTGACCAGCVPTAQIACLEIACIEPSCAPGYVQGGALLGCCYDCVPDPLYCASDSACLIADRPRDCCGCPEPISTRQYAEDLCWTNMAAPRTQPQECFPSSICLMFCGACPDPGQPKCVDHRCTSAR